MSNIAMQVLATVNAPYGANLSACRLAAMIVDPKSATDFNASVFAFFSDVSTSLQKQFIRQMGIDEAKARAVAADFSRSSGYVLPLAA